VKTIGLRSVTVIVLTLLTLAAVFWSGIMDPSRLKETHQIAFFFVGFSAALVSMLFIQFWDILNPSSFCLTVCREPFEKRDDDVVLVVRDQWVLLLRHNEDRSALEIPPPITRFLYTLMFISFFVLTIDNRGMRLISELPGKIDLETSLYCPDEVEEKIAEQKPGCELVERAFELGLIKDLGDCQMGYEQDADTIGEICTLRQHDEPYLHYAYRQVAGFFGTVVGDTRQGLERQLGHFRLRLESVEQIADHKLLPVLATPRSSHHLFTNLPDPDGVILSSLKKTLDPNRCVTEFGELTHTLKLEEHSKRSASKAFRHIYGHLLFNPKFDAIVGFCKEYEIHWGLSDDSCERLSKTPALFLEEVGALQAVNTIIDRYQTDAEIERVQESISLLDEKYRTASRLDLIDDFKRDQASKNVKTRRPIQDLVSFQCFIAGEDSTEEFSEHEFELASQKFIATEVSVPQKEIEELYGKSIQIRLYDPISKLLAPQFSYSQLLSKQALAVGSDGAVTEEMFEHEDYVLARLELLRDSDIFLGSEWIQSRDDILALYPWHQHLPGYIKNFRKTYRARRGRM
jgi:hypothetical protein